MIRQLHIYIEVIYNGYFNLIQFNYLHTNNILLCACDTTNLNVVKYLIDSAVRPAFKSSNLDIVKWIY